MMMMLLDIIVILLYIKDITGEKIFIEFHSNYYQSESIGQSIDIVPVNETYNITVEGWRFPTKSGNFLTRDLEPMSVQCHLFISFDNQDEGIHTCQDDVGKYYMINSTMVSHYWTPKYFDWRVKCDDLLIDSDIIVGEEVQIPCKVEEKQNESCSGEIIIGWIQGTHNITQSYNLTKGSTVHFNQSFFGFSPGEGLFFYCLKILHKDIIQKRCYSLILDVLPKLNVKIKALYKTPESVGHRCFKYEISDGFVKKIYNWNSNGLKGTSNNNNQPEICLTNLTAGSYTVECLVSTNDQKSSDVIEFTVKDVLTDTGTPQQDKQLWLKYISAKEDRNRYKTIVILLAVITIILVLVIVVLIYVLIRTKCNSRDLQTVAYNQRGVHLADGKSSADISQIVVDNELYHF